MARPVVVHVAGGGALGFGHLRRSLYVATRLSDAGRCRVVLSINDTPPARQLADSTGLPVVIDSGGDDGDRALLSLADSLGDAVWFLDRPRAYSVEFIRHLRRLGPVLLFHNVCPGMWDATCCVFPIAHLEPGLAADPRWQSGMTRLVHGPEFVVVGPDVVEARRLVQASGQCALGLGVSAGASDPLGILRVVPEWLAAVAAGSVTAWVGSDTSASAEIARQADASMGSWSAQPFTHSGLFRSKLAVTAFGVTAYELVFAGVPTVTIGLTPENSHRAALFAARHGCTVHAGTWGELDRASVTDLVRGLWSDPDALGRMRVRQTGLIDGLGGERVARVVMDLATN